MRRSLRRLVPLWAVGGGLLLGSGCGTESGGSRQEPGALPELPAAAEEAPERVALLVGVGDYAPSGLPPLPGIRNDVGLMVRLLEERFGYREDEVFVLMDEVATHANIVAAFDRYVIDRVDPDTEVFVYFAGHGSRILDVSGSARAELDALDSTFVAWDSRQEGRRGERDFSDDELRSLLAAVTETTGSVTVVTDSCHSGDLVRGGAQRGVLDGDLGLDFDWVRTIWPEGVPLTEDAPGERLESSRFVHVAASRRDQSARELTAVEDGEEKTFGALTYHLVKELERAPADATWSHVIDAVVPRVRRTAHQSVEFEGEAERLVFADGRAPARGFRARSTGTGDQLEVDAGFVVGLREESVLEVRDSRGEQAVGEAVVERVFPDHAIARFTRRPADEELMAFRVIETRRGSSEPPLRVAREGAGELGEQPLVQLVDEGAEYRVVADDGGARLETIDGIRLGPADSWTVESELLYRGLAELASARGQFELDIALREATPEELEGLAAALDLSLSPARVVQRDRSSAVIEGAPTESPEKRVVFVDVVNHSEERLFVYLLSLEEGRSRNLISFQGEDFVILDPGERESMPVAIVTREDWTTGRPMLDRYLALGFPDEPLRDPHALVSRERTRGQSDALPGVLRRVVDGPLTRGGAAVDLAPEGWGVASLDLLVIKP